MRQVSASFGTIALSCALTLGTGACSHTIPDTRHPSEIDLGTRLTYSFDFEQAARDGMISAEELADKNALLHQIAEVLRRRVNSPEEAQVRIRIQGDHQLKIEVPGSQESRLAQIKSLIQNPGHLELAIIASEEDAIDLAAERTKFELWMDGHPSGSALEFCRVASADGGPSGEIVWMPLGKDAVAYGADFGASRFCLPVLAQDQIRPELAGGVSSWRFQESDLEYAGPTVDQAGLPAVAFEFVEHRKAAFSDFTEAYVNRSLAIVINQQVFNAPNINGRLPGGGIIMGGRSGFTLAERDELVRVLRSGPLKVVPNLESTAPILPK